MRNTIISGLAAIVIAYASPSLAEGNPNDLLRKSEEYLKELEERGNSIRWEVECSGQYRTDMHYCVTNLGQKRQEIMDKANHDARACLDASQKESGSTGQNHKPESCAGKLTKYLGKELPPVYSAARLCLEAAELNYQKCVRKGKKVRDKSLRKVE